MLVSMGIEKKIARRREFLAAIEDGDGKPCFSQAQLDEECRAFERQLLGLPDPRELEVFDTLAEAITDPGGAEAIRASVGGEWL